MMDVIQGILFQSKMLSSALSLSIELCEQSPNIGNNDLNLPMIFNTRNWNTYKYERTRSKNDRNIRT